MGIYWNLQARMRRSFCCAPSLQVEVGAGCLVFTPFSVNSGELINCQGVSHDRTLVAIIGVVVFGLVIVVVPLMVLVVKRKKNSSVSERCDSSGQNTSGPVFGSCPSFLSPQHRKLGDRTPVLRFDQLGTRQTCNSGRIRECSTCAENERNSFATSSGIASTYHWFLV